MLHYLRIMFFCKAILKIGLQLCWIYSFYLFIVLAGHLVACYILFIQLLLGVKQCFDLTVSSIMNMILCCWIGKYRNLQVQGLIQPWLLANLLTCNILFDFLIVILNKKTLPYLMSFITYLSSFDQVLRIRSCMVIATFALSTSEKTI